MRRLIQTETGVRAFWELTSAGRRLQFHNGIRELIGQFPTGSYLLRTVHPESDTRLTNLSAVLQNQPDSGGLGIARKCPLLAIELSTRAGLVTASFEASVDADRRSLRRQQMSQRGIRFARRGGAPEYPYDEGHGFALEPGQDHPLLIPSAGDARPKWSLPDFIRAVEQALDGRIAVLQFRGVPDTAHDWVSSHQQNFEAYMK